VKAVPYCELTLTPGPFKALTGVPGVKAGFPNHLPVSTYLQWFFKVAPLRLLIPEGSS